MQSSLPSSSSDGQPRTGQPEPTPSDPTGQPSGYHAQHGSGASAQPVSARLVPYGKGPQRPRRAVALGGEDSTSAVGARKRLATSALSPVPQVSADSDTAKLQELVLASIPKEVVEGVKDVKELSAVVKSQGETILQHAEIIRILRGTAMEQDNRLQAALIKLNLTIAATDKLDDAVELIEVDQAAVVSDFKELKTEVAAMKHVIESKEVEQDDKLTRLVEQRHLDVHGLTKELQEKMATVESTFVKVEQLLFAMNGDREKYALMAAGMHDLVASTGAVVPPSTTSVDIAALKIRTAQTAECTNDVKEAVDDVQQKVVSMEVNMQGAVAQITEFVLQSTSQVYERTAAVVAERERVLCTQIETAMVEVSKGACKCPANCPGTACGRPTPPPGMAEARTGYGQTSRPPFLNGAGAFNQPQAPGGGGPPRGPGGAGPPGGGGFGPSQPMTHDIYSEDGHHAPRRLMKSSKSPFDSKAARDELPRYDGKTKPELWRKKVTYYLHSKNANMQNLLRWAELQKDPITSETLAIAVYEENSLAMLSDDPEALSYHLWGFLNVNLTDAAWDLFDGVDMENGLEVWRVVNLELTQRTQSELLALEDAVLTPLRVTEMKDIDRALVAWDAALRNYLEAGGTDLSKHRQVGAIMRLIPVRVRDQALWEFDKFEGKPDVLRRWIRERTQWFTKADAGRPSGARAHVLENQEFDMPSLLDEDELHQMEAMADEELRAFIRRKLQQKTGRPAGGTLRRDRAAPPRDKRDITCPNCLKKGHTSQECKAPKVAASDRKCFECGEPGHISSKCPNRSRAQVLTEPAASDGPKPVWLGCVHDGDEVPVHRRKRTPFHKAVVQPPRPQGCTLGDCMGRAFAQLAELERSEDQQTSAGSKRRHIPHSASEAHPAEASRAQDAGCGTDKRRVRAGWRAGSGATLDSPLMSCSAKPEVTQKTCLTSSSRGDLAERMTARREEIEASKIQAHRDSSTPSWRQKVPLVPVQLNNFWGLEVTEELNVLPEDEPEFIEIEMTLDTGATVHAADRIDFPGCHVLESPGSRAGQHFQTAGKKTIPNEGQSNILLTTMSGVDMAMTVQIAKISRPLLSVTKMTEGGEVTVLCKKDVALVLDGDGKTVATFDRKGGLYTCMMKCKNPKFEQSEDFPRPHE
ncbi:MAG: hypothetical protein CMH65_05125 [Nevskiales bacterium]|nr:hypothetical protein [Nevskiales bacterium]